MDDPEADEVEAYAISVSDLEVNAADTWTLNKEDNTCTYHHATYRYRLFLPGCCIGGPSVKILDDVRETFQEFSDGTTDTEYDNWRKSDTESSIL